jgi:hypothetical protein
MKILNAEVRDFMPFRFSGIKRLTMECGSDIQIFIGDNGSGKSSLLEELTPFAASRPTYGKKGYKKLVIHHDKSEYVLISDFTTSKGAHSFLKDGEELNISGTSGIQNELVEQHLGYTQQIENILKYKLHMTKMGKTERKNFLLGINPVNLELVLSKHKQICAKIKDLRATIKHLQQKKIQTENQLLSEDLLAELRKTHKTKNTQLINILSDINRFKTIIDEVNERLGDHKHVAIEDDLAIVNQLHSRTRKICKSLLNLVDIDKTITEEEREEIYLKLKRREEELTTRIHETSKRAEDIVSEIRKYQDYLKSEESNLTSELIHDELLRLESKTYKYHDEFVPIPKHDYKRQVSQLEKAQCSILEYISQNPKFVITRNVLFKIQRKYEHYVKKTEDIFNRELSLGKNIEELEKEKFQITMSKPCNDETSSNCEYYNSYYSRVVLLDEKLKTYREELARLGPYKLRVMKARDALQCFSMRYEYVMHLKNEIAKHLRTTVLEKDEYYLTEKLVYPQRFHTLIRSIIEDSLLHYEELENKEMILKLKSQLKGMTESNTSSTFIQDLLVQKKNEYTVALKSIAGYEEELHAYQYKSTKYFHLGQMQKAFNQIQSDFEKITDIIELKIVGRFSKKMLVDLEKSSTELTQDLRTIDETLQIQTGHLARLKDTIEDITKLELLRKDYQTIEKSLSPYTGFPHRHLVEYTNTLIHNVNCVLAQVWSYPLQIEELTYDSPFDGTFAISVDGLIVSDISRLSKGQQAIVNLAWMLAFVIGKRLLDYPIFLDECDEGLDPVHKQSLLEWLRSLIDQRLVSQLWMIHHEAVLFEGFVDSEVLCLMDGNIIRPEKMNTHVTFS